MKRREAHSVLPAFFTLLFLACCGPASGAAIIEDHTPTWTSGGLNGTIARAYDQALPDELFKRVLEEALVFEAYEKAERAKAVEGGAYMHGKGGTYWRKLWNSHEEMQKPRFAIEAAIQMIYQSDIGISAKHPRVAGGEWWVQKRSLGEDIGFHHDKDEALASLKMTMKFPEISTVTYLTDKGAPTLIFNQTTPDGNGEVPVVPEVGMLSYPKLNRHLLFRGNLQHGVPGELTPSSADSAVTLRGTSGVRITFLINWWNEKPLGPNCNAVETKMVKQLGLYDKEGMAALMATPAILTHTPLPTPTTPLPIPANPAMVKRHEVELAGSDLLWYQLPKTIEPGVRGIKFEQGQMLANVVRLTQRTAQILHHEQRTKVMVLFEGGSDAELIETVGNVAIDFTEGFKFVLANANQFGDLLRMFNLQRRDLPTAVIHKTHRGEARYAMPKGKGAQHRAGVTQEKLRDMIHRFQRGSLSPVGGHDLDDEM